MSPNLYSSAIILPLLFFLTEGTSIINHFAAPLTQVDRQPSLYSPAPSTTQRTPMIRPIPLPKPDRIPPDKVKKKVKRNPFLINHNMSSDYFVTPHNRFVFDKPSVTETKAVVHHAPFPMALMQQQPDILLNNLQSQEQPTGLHYESSEEEDKLSEESSPEGDLLDDAPTSAELHSKALQKQLQTQPMISVPPGYATGAISDLQAFLRYRNNTGTPFRMESLTAEQLKETKANLASLMSSSEASTPSSAEQAFNQDYVQDILNRFKPLMNSSLSTPVTSIASTTSDEEDTAVLPHFPPNFVNDYHLRPSSKPSLSKKFSVLTTPAASSTTATLGNFDTRVTNIAPKQLQGTNKIKQSTPTYLNRAHTTTVATTVGPDQQYFAPQSDNQGGHLEQQGIRSNLKHQSRDKQNEDAITRLPQDYPDDNLPPTSSFSNLVPASKSRPDRPLERTKDRLLIKSRQNEGKQKQLKEASTEAPSTSIREDKSRNDVVFNDDQSSQSNYNTPNKNTRGRGSSSRPGKQSTKSSSPNFSDNLYYTTDDAFLNKLTAAADTNKVDHTRQDDQEGDEHVPPSKDGTLNSIRQLGGRLGPAVGGLGGYIGDIGGLAGPVGLGYGPLHGHIPPLFPPGPFAPALLLPPFLPPPPPGPITCCKRYFPKQHGFHGLGVPILEPKTGLHGLHSNEIGDVDTGVTSTTVGSSSTISKSETFASPTTGLDLIDLKGIPGIPGESFCYQEPVFPHPLYIKQLKLQKLLFPFMLKKRLLFG